MAIEIDLETMNPRDHFRDFSKDADEFLFSIMHTERMLSGKKRFHRQTKQYSQAMTKRLRKVSLTEAIEAPDKQCPAKLKLQDLKPRMEIRIVGARDKWGININRYQKMIGKTFTIEEIRPFSEIIILEGVMDWIKIWMVESIIEQEIEPTTFHPDFNKYLLRKTCKR